MIYSIQRRLVCRQLSLDASHSPYRESRHNYFILIAAARLFDWNFSPWLGWLVARGEDKGAEALETRHLSV